MNRYATANRAKVRDLIEGMKSDKSLVDLTDEVEIARGLAAQSLSLFEGVLDNDDVSASAKAKIFIACRESLSHVADMVVKFGKALTLSPYALDAKQVDNYSAQVGTILASHIKDDELMEKIMADLNEIELDRVPRNAPIAVNIL